MTGVIVALCVLVIGALQVVAGVYALTGVGWALIALGIFTIVGGVVVARGLSG